MHIVIGTLVTAIRVSVDGGEEECALTLPVSGVDETRDDGGTVGRGPILPVIEGLVTQHPIPLAIGCVADCAVGEDGVVRVVGIHTGCVVEVGVAVALTVWGFG